MLIIIKKAVTNNAVIRKYAVLAQYSTRTAYCFIISKSAIINCFPFHQCLHYILQLIYQLTFFYIYKFYNLNILQHHMIYHIHNHNYQNYKQILSQSILCIHICIYLYSIFVYYYKHLHLIYVCTYTLCGILYIFFHQFLTLYKIL